jgi:uncharacterized protein
MKSIVITGATGVIGKKITAALLERGDRVTILTRSVDKAAILFPGAEIMGRENGDLHSVLDAKDGVISLAGENVMGRRWSEEHKKKILESRVNTTRTLIEAIEQTVIKPAAFVSASAVGYYGSSEKPVDESSPRGNGFLAGIAEAWEEETKKIDRLRIRRVNIRIGLVLDKKEGTLAKLIVPYRYFIGGPLGSGNQWFPWIHIEDIVSLFLFALDNANVNGIINGVAPDPLRMVQFCRILGRVMKRPSFIKIPSFILRLVLGEASEVILGGAQTYPTRTVSSGYKFKYPDAESALRNLLD